MEFAAPLDTLELNSVDQVNVLASKHDVYQNGLGKSIMYKKIRRFLCVPLTACFCTIAISYAQVASGGQTSSQSGPSGQNKVYVCQIGQNNKPKTKFLPEKDVLRLVESKPDIWMLGKCDDVMSPS